MISSINSKRAAKWLYRVAYNMPEALSQTAVVARMRELLWV